jgi:predicted membrane protein
VTSADLLLSTSGYLSTWPNWGLDVKVEFAIVTVILAALLFAKEIVTTSRIGGRRLSRALTIAILPLLALFLINLAMVFLL